MRHGSLFSGIGGFDLAAEWMGWENVFHCEWMPFPRKVLHYYWPKSISYEDITKTDLTIHRGDIDILTGGFHVNPTHPQESDSAKRTRDISGRTCLEQFERFNRAGSWAKMFAGLLIGTGDWYSTRCRLTWKLKATRSSRFYFQLAPSTLHTEGTESGLWPTPCARDTQGPQAQELKKMRGEKYKMEIESIPGKIRSITGVIGQLNPMFYMEIMGYPSDWTIKPFQKLEKNQSKQEAMP